MPPDAKSPQSGKFAPQDDENLPKVKRKAMKTENIAVIVKKAFITSQSRTFFLLLHFCPFQRAAIFTAVYSSTLYSIYIIKTLLLCE